jgi:hypothetical protein
MHVGDEQVDVGAALIEHLQRFVTVARLEYAIAFGRERRLDERPDRRLVVGQQNGRASGLSHTSRSWGIRRPRLSGFLLQNTDRPKVLG